jgi:hypothetical protein
MASMTKANQETDMKQTNENAVQDQDVIVLGVASIETKGPLTKQEDAGGIFPMGISNE